jgi:hypothetical protein
MIKKEELRLGSLVLMVEEFGYDESELYVSKLNDEDLELSNAHSIYASVKWKNVEPVQIFSWHLEQVGFMKKDKEVYQLQDWEYNCEKDIVTWKGEIVFSVKYVHYLQNLLYAVSGIDLNFRESDT